MKIVINDCYGGFGVSEEAMELYFQLSSNRFDSYQTKRDDPFLIKVVEDLGEAANTRFSKLKIVEIPDDILWHVEEYDGMEWVAENHRKWS